MDSVRSFMLDIERGRRESQRLRDAMSKTDPLYPYQPQPHELQALSLWRCICAHHNVLDSGLAPNPELAKNAANAGGSNEEATQKLSAMVGLYELARPHLGGELRNAGDGTCLKWLREWMGANGLVQDGVVPAQVKAEPAPKIGVRTHRSSTRKAHWLDPVIGLATEHAIDKNSRHSVWQALCELAASASPPPPLLGVSKNAIKCRDGAGHKLFNSDNFYQYWKRRTTSGNVG